MNTKKSKRRSPGHPDITTPLLVARLEKCGGMAWFCDMTAVERACKLAPRSANRVLARMEASGELSVLRDRTGATRGGLVLRLESCESGGVSDG